MTTSLASTLLADWKANSVGARLMWSPVFSLMVVVEEQQFLFRGGDSRVYSQQPQELAQAVDRKLDSPL